MSDSEFLGNLVRYTVAVGQHRLVADDGHHVGREHLEPNTAVWIGLAPERVRYLYG